jgi:hypothetical protein
MPLISSYGDLSEIKLDYSIIIEVTNLTKIANPQAFQNFGIWVEIQLLYSFRGKLCNKTEK